MTSRAVKRVARRGAGVLLCLAASCLPAFAAHTSLTTGDGSVMKVWEQKGRSTVGRPGAIWSIAFSVIDASGPHVGVVPPTGDTARDASPFLTLDSTGAPVLVWSRFDGVYNKIAYARYSAGAWTDFKYITFGSGDDDLPLIATTSNGSYLFYRGASDRYFFAPLDLEGGRLFASQRLLDLGIWHRATPHVADPGSPSTRGGLDVPINNRGCKDVKPCSSMKLARPGSNTIQGGVDAPIINSRASVWGAGSGDTCSHVVLIVPSADVTTAVVADFFNGTARGLERIALSGDIPPGLGDTLASSYLPTLCN